MVVKNDEAAATVYDMSRVTAKQMAGFFKSISNADVQAQADVLAAAVVSTPLVPAEADLRDPETYLALTYYGGFTELLMGLQDALKNAAKR